MDVHSFVYASLTDHFVLLIDKYIMMIILLRFGNPRQTNKQNTNISSYFPNAANWHMIRDNNWHKFKMDC